MQEQEKTKNKKKEWIDAVPRLGSSSRRQEFRQSVLRVPHALLPLNHPLIRCEHQSLSSLSLSRKPVLERLRYARVS